MAVAVAPQPVAGKDAPPLGNHKEKAKRAFDWVKGLGDINTAQDAKRTIKQHRSDVTAYTPESFDDKSKEYITSNDYAGKIGPAGKEEWLIVSPVPQK